MLDQFSGSLDLRFEVSQPMFLVHLAKNLGNLVSVGASVVHQLILLRSDGRC